MSTDWVHYTLDTRRSLLGPILPSSAELPGTMNGNESDRILLWALQHAGGQFGVMQEELGNLHRENCLLCQDNHQVQGLLHDTLTALGKMLTGGPRLPSTRRLLVLPPLLCSRGTPS
jgi:hypothetical protein